MSAELYFFGKIPVNFRQHYPKPFALQCVVRMTFLCILTTVETPFLLFLQLYEKI